MAKKKLSKPTMPMPGMPMMPSGATGAMHPEGKPPAGKPNKKRIGKHPTGLPC